MSNDIHRDTGAGIVAEHEALIQFMYLAPVGLVQADMAGDIAMINPISAQLLMPLAPQACLNNLFEALEGVAPPHRPAPGQPRAHRARDA
jgi:hypothetical protein